ncbi:MAG: ABC transporter ATP-binding protein [Cyanobacteria bacterium P01_A01_bin.37]
MSYLRLDGITKQFGTFVANDAIDLTIEKGTVHALLGENGAGKSTLMNILSGLYQPDGGQIFLDNQPISIASPKGAIQHGIGMIHQHFMLVPQLTVTENIILGTRQGIVLNLDQKAAEIEEMGRAYGLDVPPLATVGDLAVGIQQRVEILKVLYRRAKILILDEPTAVLTPGEIASFLDILRQLVADDHTIVFITHKLDEVMNVSDAVTILRQGKVVASMPTATTNRQDLAKLMVDRDVSVNQRSPRPSALSQPARSPMLSVNNLWVNNSQEVAAVRGISFHLHAGEILGIAGVDGNGQRELADAIAGLTPITSGTIDFPQPRDATPGNATPSNATPSNAKRAGITVGYIPEDRQSQGLVLSFSIARNLILKAFRQLPFCKNWLLRQSAIRDHALRAIQRFDIRAQHSSLKASQLSGGNQQKVILARELAGEPQLIIAMQPTRGLDIGATDYVQTRLLEQRDRGAAILYISTELEEVMAMSDRLAVLYNGQFVDVLAGEDATVGLVGLLMTGGATADASIANEHRSNARESALH